MYRIFLKRDNTTLEIPVLPEKLKISADGDNSTETVLELGQINILRKRKLRSMEWEALFPLHRGPYVSGVNLLAPIEYIRTLEDWRSKPLRFTITGADLNINTSMAIESLDYEERGGEPGDLYYTLELKEYVDYTPRRITINADGTALIVPPARPGSVKTGSVSHVVLAGESIWMLAQRYYGDGSLYDTIYQANKAGMDARNQTTGGTRYTLYTGQVLTIP